MLHYKCLAFSEQVLLAWLLLSLHIYCISFFLETILYMIVCSSLVVVTRESMHFNPAGFSFVEYICLKRCNYNSNISLSVFKILYWMNHNTIFYIFFLMKPTVLLWNPNTSENVSLLSGSMPFWFLLTVFALSSSGTCGTWNTHMLCFDLISWISHNWQSVKKKKKIIIIRIIRIAIQ